MRGIAGALSYHCRLSLTCGQDPELPTFNTLVRIMATRCMLSAEYFCSGSVARDTFGHYGLASPIYTHFTSPSTDMQCDTPHLAYKTRLQTFQMSWPIVNWRHPSDTPRFTRPKDTSLERTLEVVNRRHRMAQIAGRASVEF